MDAPDHASAIGSVVEDDVAARKTPGGGRKPRAGTPATRIVGVRFAPAEAARLSRLAEAMGVKESDAVRVAVAELADRKGVPRDEHDPAPDDDPAQE